MYSIKDKIFENVVSQTKQIISSTLYWKMRIRKDFTRVKGTRSLEPVEAVSTCLTTTLKENSICFKDYFQNQQFDLYWTSLWFDELWSHLKTLNHAKSFRKPILKV